MTGPVDPPELAATTARRLTILAAILMGLADLLVGVIHWVPGGGTLALMRIFHAVVAFGVALILIRARAVSARWSIVAFLVLVAPMFSLFWYAALSGSRGLSVRLFMARKVSILCLAVLSPSLALGAGLIVLLAGQCLIEWFVFHVGRHAALQLVDEPWATMFAVAIGLVFLAQRWRARRFARQLLGARAEIEALHLLRQVALSVRDRVNTPLQSLALGIKLTRVRHPDDSSVTDRMSRSLRAIASISHAMDGFDAQERRTHFQALRDAGEGLESDLSDDR